MSTNKFQIKNDFPNAVYFSFPSIITYLNDKNEVKKKMSPYSWNMITKSKVIKGHTAYAFKTGNISNITVLDIDKQSTYDELVEFYPQLESLYTVKTNKGYHIYFEYHPELNNGTDVMDDFEGVDIRNDGGIIYAPPTTYELPDKTVVHYKLIGGDVIAFPDELFNLLNNKGKKTKVVTNVDKKIKTKTTNTKVVTPIEPVVSVAKYTKQQLMQLVQLIDKKRADDYAEWTKIGIIINSINNTNDGFEVFKMFSQKSSEKYTNDDKCKAKWNTFNKLYSNVSIASLIYYARTDNKPEFDKLDCNFVEAEHFNPIEFNRQYILGDECVETKKQIKEFFLSEQKIFAIKSAYSTGKTQAIHHMIDNYKPKKILFITYRQTLSFNFEGSFERHNVKNYLNGDYLADRLICQIESLAKLITFNMITGDYCVPTYDLIVLDESESILSHLESPTIKNKLGAFNIMDALLKKAKKILALDGDFGNKTYDYLKNVNKHDAFTVLKNQYVPTVKNWKFTSDKGTFDANLMNDLESGKKIFICTMSSEIGQKYRDLLKNDYKVCCHYGTGDDELKEELKQVNEFWIQYDVVICSPTVEAGVDFNVPHFDKQYVILSGGSTSPRGLCQMTARVRNWKDLTVECYLNNLPYHEKANLYRKDEVDSMFETQLKDLNFEVDDEGNIKATNEALTNIHKYNYVEILNKNNSYFVASLIQLLKQKGQTYEYDQTVQKKQKSDSITKENLKAVELIDKQSYLALLKLQKQNMATADDKLQIEKYLYSVNWELKEIPDEVMDKIFRKTHILYNQKAINNVFCKSYVSNVPDYQDIDLKIKLQKLKIVNDLLQTLTFKDENNEFTKNEIECDKWEAITEKAQVKSKLFTDKTVTALFEMKKTAITTNKKFLGFVNSILNNYGCKIVNIRSNKKDSDGNKISKYCLQQLDLME